MRALVAFVVICALIDLVRSIRYDNVTVEPALRQLYDFKLNHPITIGQLTSSSGEPVEIRDTFQINSDQFSNQFHLDLQTKFDAERIPERIVHAKGSGAFGYLEITNDVTQYTSANLFSKVGKKTPLVVRMSSSPASAGGSDLNKEFKGMAIKFYTEEGNLDMLCLQTPVFIYKEPSLLPHLAKVFKRNARTGLQDPTAIWDLLTLKPEMLHNFFYLQSDYGSPNGYRRMDGFPIHAYEINNKKGDKYYVRFNFRTNQGLANLTLAQIAQIQGVDLDYFIRDLYNAIERKQYPSWTMEMDMMTFDNLTTLDYNPFDVTRLWKKGTYTTIPIGQLVLNRNPDNYFKVAEQSAFNPANLVPGIPGPVDSVFKIRRLTYLDTQNYRLGRNHNNILVNEPIYARTYNRDGRPPVKENMRDAPNYYPNSFNGPMPYVDESRPEQKLVILDSNAIDFQNLADFYNIILVDDGQRRRLVESFLTTLPLVPPNIQRKAVKMMYLIDPELGKRVEIGLKAAMLSGQPN